MNARAIPAGDESAEPRSDGPAPQDTWERQFETLERLIAEHRASHAARLETLNRQSEQYLATLEAERREIAAARERQRSGAPTHEQAARNAEALKA